MGLSYKINISNLEDVKSLVERLRPTNLSLKEI